LSILSEKILNMPKMRGTGEGYMEAHPNFRAIFTSNPEEYAGTHKTQDALMDRMITLLVGHYDRETEVQITKSKSGLGLEDSEIIVDIVRELREMGECKHRPSIRSCIAIAKILALKGGHARWGDPVFEWVTRDVLSTETAKVTRAGECVPSPVLGHVIQKVCGPDRESFQIPLESGQFTS
jgi:gas vesicle protein GvpN